MDISIPGANLKEDDLFGSRYPAGHEVPIKPDCGPGFASRGRTSEDEFGDILKYGTPEQGRGKPAKKKPIDHNPRTKKYFTDRGFFVGKAETIKSFPGGHVKTDFLGIADYIAFNMESKVFFVQACAKGQVAAHLRKFRDIPEAKVMASNPYIRLIIIAWDKPGAKWEPEIITVTTQLLEQSEVRKRN